MQRFAKKLHLYIKCIENLLILQNYEKECSNIIADHGVRCLHV
jgi:hypothetical protein